MTKSKEIKDVILTEREQEMIKWAANGAYESIRADFWDDEKEKYFEAYMSVVLTLNQREHSDAMYFICILLDQGYNEELAKLVTKICNPKDGSMELFMEEFKNYIIYDMFYEDEEDDFDEDEFDDDDVDEEMELYDVNFEGKVDEDPFAIISVTVDKEKCPEFESKMKDILQALGATFSGFRKKESEEDE